MKCVLLCASLWGAIQTSCWERSADAIVRGAHPSKSAKGEAARVLTAQRWASPRFKLVTGTFRLSPNFENIRNCLMIKFMKLADRIIGFNLHRWGFEKKEIE